jgi:flagellin-like protein
MIRGVIKSKKGISDVVTTILFILLALVAIGIVWGLVSTLLGKGTEESANRLECLEADVNIKSAEVYGSGRYDIDGNELSAVGIVVERQAGKTDSIVNEVAFVFENDEGLRKVIKSSDPQINQTFSLKPLESRSFNFIYNDVFGEEFVPTMVAVSVVIEGDLCQASDTEALKIE